MRLSKSLARVYAVLIAIALMLAYVVYAGNEDPVGPKAITKVKSERMDSWGPGQVWNEAGNVTELWINATGITHFWAGFFGNITGVITLDDALNWTMYDWMAAEPQGEVYASIHNVNWPSINCLNFTSTYSKTSLEHNLSMEHDAYDSVNATFCPGCSTVAKDVNPIHPEFWAGKRRFYSGDCWALNTYVQDNAQSSDFIEVLLQDGVAPIYTTIIEDKAVGAKGKKTGFDNRLHDFQLMVGENGNGTNSWTSTLYYFYVELE